jgi:FdhE protein
MAETGAFERDTTVIGEVANPDFARLPDPAHLFSARAERYRFLAQGHDLGPYLLFLADLSEAQHHCRNDLPIPAQPDADRVKRAREFGMPPLDRANFGADPAFETMMGHFLALAERIAMPKAAAEAFTRLRNAEMHERVEMARSVLSHAIPMQALAEHLYVAAVLQIHFTRLAAQLDARSLVPVGDAACPVCGSPPAASIVVGWQGAHGTRYCGCGLCGTLWNYVRIKCTLCASTEGISYQEIEGGSGIVKAETCRSCQGYVKILHQHRDPMVDIIADDVASLGLDLLVREAGFKRGSMNPFLLGY